MRRAQPNEEDNELKGLFYYSLVFSFSGDSFKAVSRADREVTRLAELKLHILQVEHEYSWPDGSLCFLVRSKTPLTIKMLNEEVFIEDWLGSTVKVYGITSVNPRYVRITPLTYEERFELEKPASIRLITKRFDERNGLMLKYRETRTKCTTCKKGKNACETCSVILAECEKKLAEWESRPRIMEG
tara:strand:- start:12609 stop:13166 length:558 start_codon:yes stop_codon:yes gene_type:complete